MRCSPATLSFYGFTAGKFLLCLATQNITTLSEVEAKEIQKKWGYLEDGNIKIEPEPTTIFGIIIKGRKDKPKTKKVYGMKFLWPGISHSLGLDILYFSIFLYALIRMVQLILRILS